MTIRTLILISILVQAYLSQTDQLAYAGEWKLYPHPDSFSFQEGDQELPCEELENRLRVLEPLTYSYKPGFYADPAHAAAIWGGVLWSPGWSYLGYSGLAEYQEQKRIANAGQRIAELRQLKAKRHCFER